MILKQLFLQDFRSYSQKSVEFGNCLNLIAGPNASGKTNLLEAIYFLASGRSFRVKGVEREAIRYGRELGRIKGWVIENEEKEKGEDKEKQLEIVLTCGEVAGEKTGKKRYLVNGIGKRAFDFVGNLKAVYFGPEDLELVTDSPSLRRKYLDMVLSQTDKEYARASLSYEKGLKQRNKILEDLRQKAVEGQGNSGQLREIGRRRLYFWDKLLIKNGNIITAGREEFIAFLNTKVRFDKFQEMGSFNIEYERSTISEERLARYADEEIAAGATLVGPHRDDMKFRVQESKFKVDEEIRDLSVFGSRGEQRLAILWLKLGEAAFIEEKTFLSPILLLDDIFSELDVEHRRLIFDLIGDRQTVMTTADVRMVDEKWLEGVKVINLKPEG